MLPNASWWVAGAWLMLEKRVVASAREKQKVESWIRGHDLLAGEDAVKAAGAKYLPRLAGQNDEDYLAYQARACFSNATRRAVDAFVGLVFRKAPFVKPPEDGGQRSEVRNGSTSPKPLPGAKRVTRRTASGIAKAMQVFVNDADMLGTSLFGYAKNRILYCS